MLRRSCRKSALRGVFFVVIIVRPQGDQIGAIDDALTINKYDEYFGKITTTLAYIKKK